MTKYTTISHKPSYTAALGGGDSKFVFKKRVFRRPKEIPDDPVEYHLMYAQAVHSVVKVSERRKMQYHRSSIIFLSLLFYFPWQIDEFPVNEAVALQLAGLQAQVLWGAFDANLISRYDEIEQFIPVRIISSNKSKTREDWKKAIGNAHKVREWNNIIWFVILWYFTSYTGLLMLVDII